MDMIDDGVGVNVVEEVMEDVDVASLASDRGDKSRPR